MRAVLRAMAVPEGVVGDAVTIVSELAANAFVHGFDDQSPDAPPELVMYRRDVEIVTKVFDSAPWIGRLPRRCVRPDLYAESGRGLEMVNALTAEHGGSWGVHRTRSRLSAAAVSGKVAYFALPIPEPHPVVRSAPDCRTAGRVLEAALMARGLKPVHRCEGLGMAVLSVRPEITVFARQGGFSLTTPLTGTVRYPLAEVVEVSEVVVWCNEELDAG